MNAHSPTPPAQPPLAPWRRALTTSGGFSRIQSLRASVSIADGVAVLVITATLTLALSMGSAFSGIAAIVVAIALFIALLLGRTVLSVVPVTLPDDAIAPAEIVLGFGLLCAAMLCVVLVGKVGASTSFIICCAASLALCLWRAHPHQQPRHWTPSALWQVLMICCIAFVWSWEAINTMPRLLQSGVFSSWIDFFVHASFVTQFAEFSALRGTSIFVAGEPIGVYHFGSYMLPATIKAFTDLSAMAVVTTLWGLLGFIMLGIGAIVIGNVLAGRTGGVAAVVAVMLFPSAAHYGFENTFFDYYWALQVFCGSSYSLSSAMLALAFGILALRGSQGAWALAITAGALVAIFRVHIFVLLALSGVLILFLYWRPARASFRPAFFAALLPAGVVAALVAEYIPRAPHFVSGHYDPLAMIASLTTFAPGSLAWLKQLAALSLPTLVILSAAVFVVLVSAFGALLLAYLAAIFNNRQKLKPEDTVPLCMLVAYIVMLCTFPVDDRREFQHRPFVLVHAVLAIWCSVFVARAIRHWLTQRNAWLLATVACAMLAYYPLSRVGRVQGAGNTWALELPSVNFKVNEGLRQATEYIRHHAAMSDVVWSDKDDRWAINTAFMERTAFSSIESFAESQRGQLRGQILARRDVASTLRASKQSDEQFVAAATSAGIDWCLLSAEFQLPDALLARVVFSAGGFRVVRIKAPPSSTR